jgi:hypothetical protein
MTLHFSENNKMCLQYIKQQMDLTKWYKFPPPLFLNDAETLTVAEDGILYRQPNFLETALCGAQT